MAPKNDEVLREIGLVFDQRRQFDRALEMYQMAIAAAPKSSANYTRAGVAYRNLKSYAEAVGALEKAVTLDGKNLEATKQLAVVSAMNLVQSNPVNAPVLVRRSRSIIPSKKWCRSACNAPRQPTCFSGYSPPSSLCLFCKVLIGWHASCIESSQETPPCSDPTSSNSSKPLWPPDKPTTPGKSPSATWPTGPATWACSMPWRALAAQDSHAAAAEVLERLVAVDPEDSAAQRSLGQTYQALGREPEGLTALANAHVIDGQGTGGAVPEWATRARAAQLAERIGDWATAQREALAATRAEPGSLLAALRYLAALWHTGQLDLAGHLSDGLLKLWPQLAAPKLCLAESLMAQGIQPRAIELLHSAAAHDAGGQVVTRHWGSSHPYKSLWDMNVSLTLPGPLPGDLINMLGLNQLRGGGEAPSGNTAGHAARPAVSEEIADIQAQLDAVAARLPSSSQTVKQRLLRLTRAERPRPKAASTPATYVVLSSRTRLNQIYGQAGFTQIDAALRTLVATASRRAGLKPCLLYVDDPAALSPYGVRPANPVNAWEIKTLIGKLAARLKTLDSSIGALLIVGGSEIIPFHHLPNPTDDADPDIPSDNPYATADDNYFVPEWPIARLPTGAGNDPAALLRALHHMGGVVGPARRPCTSPGPIG